MQRSLASSFSLFLLMKAVLSAHEISKMNEEQDCTLEKYSALYSGERIEVRNRIAG